MSSNIAATPSYVRVPDGIPTTTILEFLVHKFPTVSKDSWIHRFERNLIQDEEGTPLAQDSMIIPQQLIGYYREIKDEPIIPFEETILFENENIIVADKPHFLPVHPAGEYVTQSLLNRLIIKTDNKELIPAHRIDRETAGLVLLIKTREHRNIYQNLFSNNEVSKTYHAVVKTSQPVKQECIIENHIAKTDEEPWFLMKVFNKEPNSKTAAKLLSQKGNLALYEFKPVTGKKHQLRLHSCIIADGILNDRFYPAIQDKSPDDYNRPLQLLAKELSFIDPLTKERLIFKSQLKLNEL